MCLRGWVRIRVRGRVSVRVRVRIMIRVRVRVSRDLRSPKAFSGNILR